MRCYLNNVYESFRQPGINVFIMRGVVCLAICTGGGQPLRVSGWFLQLEGGIFEKIIDYVMYCRMWGGNIP